MTDRKRLPNRRRSETTEFMRDGSRFKITIGYYDNGNPGEVFFSADRANSLLDVLMSDAAIAISIALQHGAQLHEIAHALKRDGLGLASSPIGAAIDRITPPEEVKRS